MNNHIQYQEAFELGYSEGQMYVYGEIVNYFQNSDYENKNDILYQLEKLFLRIL